MFQCDQANEWQDYRRLAIFAVAAAAIIALVAHVAFRSHHDDRGSPHSADCWHICYGDVRAGVIAHHTEVPDGAPPWHWHCGFYPGSHPGERTKGAAETLEEARIEFEAAWS